MGHLAEHNRDVKVIHKLPGRKPKIFLGNARWRQDRARAAPAASVDLEEAGEADVADDDGATAMVCDTAARRGSSA